MKTSYPKKLIIVSYFSATPGTSPAEWVQDKLQCARELDQEILLLTSIATIPFSIPGLKLSVFRLPSLSWRDFKEEMGIRARFGRRKGLLVLFYPLSFVFGSIFDFIFRWSAGSDSDGKWSWGFATLPALLCLSFLNPKTPILATGGPSVASFVAAMSSKLLRRNFLVEFQDPFVGSEMVMTSRARSILETLEKIIVSNSTSTIFATKGALEAAKIRNPEIVQKMTFLYPGAWPYLKPKESEDKRLKTNFLEFLHVGTLYGTRNLDYFLSAVDAAVMEGTLSPGSYKVVNLGGLHVANKSEYTNRVDFELLPTVGRLEALERAAKASVLLLVQHTDSRSRETIPFKTYDYLNIGKRILGILNNPELEAIIQDSYGNVASATSVSSIVDAIREIVDKEEPEDLGLRYSRFDAVTQWRKMMSLFVDIR